MWFESYERHQAEKLEKQWQEEYGVKMEGAEAKANPEFWEVAKEKWEQQKEADKKEIEKTEEQMKNSREKIAQSENPERAQEVQQAESSLDSDMWPPMSFDDTDSYAQAQIGNTEGGQSLDKKIDA